MYNFFLCVIACKELNRDLMVFFQGQAFDHQVNGDPLSEARLDLFKVNVQYNRDAISRSTFFLCGQICVFVHRLLRMIMPRSCLLDEWDWDALQSFDFDVG